MRFSLSVFALIMSSAPLWAEEIMGKSVISEVTVYPYGAMITRAVSFEAPAGVHQVVLNDMPAQTVIEAVKAEGGDGVGAGAIWLRDGRLALDEAALTPAQEAAKALVEEKQAALDAASDAVDLARGGIDAALAEQNFYANVYSDTAITPEALKALGDQVAKGVAEAQVRLVAAGAALRPLEKAVEKATEARDLAQAAYDALPGVPEDRVALSVQVNVAGDGPHALTVTQFVDAAGWMPSYDLHLMRKSDVPVTLTRAILVFQDTGEDWQGVTLAFSTAQPTGQAMAGDLWPEYREIYDPAEEEAQRKAMAEGAVADAELMVTAAAEPVMVEAGAVFQGDVLTYRLSAPTDVASGVENLRLPLDDKVLAAEVFARAVPRRDSVAYLTAEIVNGDEILLPGTAMLYSDGNLVGAMDLPRLAAGDDVLAGFGPIDGLTLERRMPETAEGDRGVFSTATERVTRADLIVKNLTGEVWPVRMDDQVPYSEQEDLEITFEASVVPDEVEPEGQRGILRWRFDLAPDEEKTVTLTETLRWPSGMALR